MEKKLYRSPDNRMIGGVCGGLAEYLGVDPTVVRLIMALVTFVGGMSLLVYLIMWLIIPEKK
ncbi:MAG: PspC domain-containing protein [Alistipes sp.]|jgi:phage shock protein C|nr:PspC domain-containing protein [Alistipes sp.]